MYIYIERIYYSLTRNITIQNDNSKLYRDLIPINHPNHCFLYYVLLKKTFNICTYQTKCMQIYL